MKEETKAPLSCFMALELEVFNLVLTLLRPTFWNTSYNIGKVIAIKYRQYYNNGN